MQWKTSTLLLLMAAPAIFAAPSKEIVQIQRDLALLQEQIRSLQQAQDEKLVRLTTLVEQALQSTSKANTSLAVLESGLRDRLSQQLAAPITGVSTRVEQMSNEFSSVRESVSDMNERMSRIQAQLVEISNTIRTLQAPPAPPPAVTGAPAAAAGPPAGLSPSQLYESALRDRSGGNLDLAMQGFQEYLKWFSNTELAPNAQFYIGQIYYDKGDLPSAVQAFDTVLEKFPENNKTADAMYMKGMALLKSGQRTQAAQEFLTVIQKYPNAEVTAKAKAQRKALGLSVPEAKSAAPARRRR
jgi:tol-pal system protein YbgF